MRCRDIPRLSTVAGSGDGTQSRQEARLGLQPLTDYAGKSFTIGRPSLRKDVIDDVIRFDAERVLNDLGGLFAVVTVDGSFQQVTHLRTVTRDIKPPTSRHDNLLHFANACDVEWSRVRKPHSPISAPRVAQKIKRQHHRIDERLHGLGCAVVVVRSHPLLRRLRSLHLQGLIFALKVVRPHRNISK